jgi:broad-specificity NMP kinase
MDKNAIACPVCGRLGTEDIDLYSLKLRRQNFGLSPLLPTCKVCGSEVGVRHSCAGGTAIILNGTCGSGKSTVAETLMNRYGFYAMDGDCVMQSVRRRLFYEKLVFEADAGVITLDNTNMTPEETAREIVRLASGTRGEA